MMDIYLQCFTDIHSDSLLKDRSNIFMSDAEKKEIREVIVGVPTLYFVGMLDLNQIFENSTLPNTTMPLNLFLDSLKYRMVSL